MLVASSVLEIASLVIASFKQRRRSNVLLAAEEATDTAAAEAAVMVMVAVAWPGVGVEKEARAEVQPAPHGTCPRPRRGVAGAAVRCSVSDDFE